MHASPQDDLYFLQFRLPLLTHRLANYRKLALSRLPADMRKTKKVKGLRLPFPTFRTTLSGKPPKLNQTRFVRVQFQSKPRKPLTQF